MNYKPHHHLDDLTFVEKSIIHHQLTEGNIEYIFWEQVRDELTATYAVEQAYGDPEKIAELPKHFKYVMLPYSEFESDKYHQQLSTAESLVRYMVSSFKRPEEGEVIKRMPYRRLKAPAVEQAVIAEPEVRKNWFQRIFA